jgi:ATP-binding cassette subfamily B (MDR/TAP) protein 1
VALGILPVMMLAGKCNAQENQGFSAKHEEFYTAANGSLSEALNNMRTVASFAREDFILSQYSNILAVPLKAIKKKSLISGISLGFSEFVRFAVYAVIFIVGAYFVIDIDLSISGMYSTMFGILFGAFGAGNSLQFLPEVGAARQAVIGLLSILDTPSEIDITDTQGKITRPIKGEITFENVSFKYPMRDQFVFKNLTFTVSAYDKVALVGSSGCGKSTVIQLIMRFYDLHGGRILLDREDIRNYDLKHLRQSIGIVSQEPVLFNGTIEENIK